MCGCRVRRLQGGFAFKHKDNNLVVSAPEGVPLSDIDTDRVKAEADALQQKKASAVRRSASHDQ